MRSGFGKAAQQIRAQRGMTQSEFAEKTGWSLSRISNIEFQRAAVSDDVLRVYLDVLKTTGKEANLLRKLARFSNEVMKQERSEAENPTLIAMMRQFGDKLPPKALAEIQEIIERETGEQVSSLTFANTKMKNKRVVTRKKLTPSLKRFVQICILASRLRQRHCLETHKLNLGMVLEKMSVENEDFDYRISEKLPTVARGAFAVIVGESHGVTLHFEESRFKNMIGGTHFCRHVVAHEIAHYILHRDMLASNNEMAFEPQTLAQNSPQMVGETSVVKQVVDTVEEAEAECFATFLLVPWEAYLRGTKASYLSKDFGEQIEEIKRYIPFLKQKAVIEEFKEQLWIAGERTHPIFHET